MSRVPESDFDAVRLAHEVTGLYGDPDVTWGISLEAEFETPLDPVQITTRLQGLVAEYPHLGAVPRVERADGEAWDTRREQVASAELGTDGRLVHVLLDDAATRVLITAHHGVCDGLGLVALLSGVAGVPVVSSARGVGETPAPRSFLGSSLLRLLEAVFTPPARFSGAAPELGAGSADHMRHVVLDDVRVNGALACHALLQAHGQWPRRRNSGGRRFMVIMGASRRQGSELHPDRQTTFLRIRLRPHDTAEQVAAIVRTTDPEPDFPETSAGGIGPLVTKALRSRLGYTVNVSNLGVLSGDGLLRATMFPALSGPMALGVGLVTVRGRASVSVRMRRTEHADHEADRLMRDLADRLTHGVVKESSA
ncbi:hypothetical protein [Nocardioides yefusunii]|uniref:Condensation domain-containing protein n=1 Tax=Nocardioides yefusunii TaxID=2500546 RepID=A0ABW1QWC3_9ACTN|nr:hypothetical protein [Nocardioides yefusunii]